MRIGTMKSVRVKRNEVLDKVRANLSEHEQIYKEAVIGYKAAVKDITARLAALAARDEEILETLRELNALKTPSLHKTEYIRAIKMLEMSADEVIELQEHEFAQLVMDDWQWQRSWLGGASAYAPSAMRKLETFGVEDEHRQW